jgi:hypothetical protein
MKNPNEIILIHGTPRSGTSWLGQIIDSSPEVRYKYQPLFSNSFKDAINTKSSQSEIKNFFQKVYHYEDDFLDRVKEKEKGVHKNFTQKREYPHYLALKHVRYHFLLPHILKNTDNVKVVCIVRNPCGTLNSWRKAPKEFRTIDGIFSEQWRFAQKRTEFKPEEYFGFHKWKEAVKIFLTTEEWFPKKVKVISYENLINNLKEEVQSIYNFLNLTIEEQTLEFLKESTSKHNSDVYSVFKGKNKKDRWNTELNPQIIKEVYDELKNSEFEQFLK